jgi:hypothetical protein
MEPEGSLPCPEEPTVSSEACIFMECALISEKVTFA